jgi:2-hydroxychromene-2-carboxylate isomerase
VNSEAARKEYADSNSEAKVRGIFGVPMMVVGEQMFWGNDRLDFLEEYLATRS